VGRKVSAFSGPVDNGCIPIALIRVNVRFDPANISEWLVDMGDKRMSKQR
jgi:hypothetical protein